MSSTPKVFLSHASEDKDRFVLAFARTLRESGIDVWLDRWEMNPGDSLTDRIFEEGIGGADAFIVVLSANSVGKKWVRDELNAALVERISKGTRLIPVVLDGAEVPVALRSTLWEVIPDPADFDQSARRIVSALHGQSLKPALGPPPAHIAATVPAIGGLTKLDVLVLQQHGELALRKGDTVVLNTEEVWHHLETAGVARQDYLDSCAILSKHGHLEPTKQLSPVPQWHSITLSGMETYLSAFDPAYPNAFRNVGLAVANESMTDADDLATRLGLLKVTVVHILLVMERRGFIQVGRYLGGHTRVHGVLAPLRRFLQGPSAAG